MGNTQSNKVNPDKDKGQFIRVLMKHGYTLKEAQKEYLSHKQFLAHVQEIADLTGKPISVVTEIVLDQLLTVAVEGKEVRKYATNKKKGQVKEEQKE